MHAKHQHCSVQVVLLGFSLLFARKHYCPPIPPMPTHPTCIILVQQVALGGEEVDAAGGICNDKIQGSPSTAGPARHHMAARDIAVSCNSTQKGKVAGPQLGLPGNQALRVGCTWDEASQ